MPTYTGDFSNRKMKAVQAMVAEIKKIEILKKKGGKKLLAQYGYKGNQPKMALRGLRSFLLSEDNLFADLLEQYETKGKTFGDTKESVRGQSYTTRGHLNQATNPRGRYKATNEFSEPGRTDISAHPRGPNDPLMKAPDVKPTTRAEANAFVETIEPLTKESVQLGSYADKDVRALADQKVTERGIIQPGDTLYRSDLPDETLRLAQNSLNNVADEVDLAKAFKTPQPLRMENGVIRFNSIDPVGAALNPLLQNPVGSVLGAVTEGYNKETIQKLEQGDVVGATTNTAVGAVTGAVLETGIKKAGLQTVASKAVPPLAGVSLFNEGRPGSTTDYVINQYGPKVGMNQNRPSWGTAGGQMPTQKPAHVQGVEDAIDSVGNEVEYRAKQAFNFLKGLIPSGGSIKYGY